MDSGTDPIRAALGDSEDLYDIATWEQRTGLDRLSARVYGALRRGSRAAVIFLALLLFFVQLALSGYAVIRHPSLGVVTALSVIPALGLAGFVWYEDPTLREPFDVLAVTFLLGVLFASFAAFVDTILGVLFQAIPVIGMALFFYLAVGPVEETVKWSAVRMYAYRSDSFDAVIDGAVYGAVAGLGFATIENSIYITRAVLTATAAPNILQPALQAATARALAGPGHVLYAAFSGYYLGLAKYNPGNRGPIIVKGLLIAALIHATYDTIVTYVGFSGLGFVGFVVVYDGLVGYLLYRKLSRYRSKYREVQLEAPEEAEPAGEPTE
ncbi:MAG: PrsW family intramembrane metalloprotease [Salinigranum sp.]